MVLSSYITRYDKKMKKPVKAGNITFGDGHIYIQSMLNVRADDIENSVKQAQELEIAGCEVIRAAVPKPENANLIPALKKSVSVPIVADIHFDYRIALKCAEMGVDKIRINPGNIGTQENVRAVAKACKKRGIPIRIGVNSGSLEKRLLEKYGGPVPEAFVESALDNVKLLNMYDFDDIVISIKSSDVRTTIASYRLLHEQTDYPLHLGVTETGTAHMGIIKSAVGIGSLLCDGIGDTMRVSLTADPVEEVKAAKDILKACGMGGGVNIVSCPTCGRTQIDLISLANKVEQATLGIEKDLKIAVMGCIVNGPGEARDADLGITGGNGKVIIFRKGETLCTVPEDQALNALMEEISKL